MLKPKVNTQSRLAPWQAFVAFFRKLEDLQAFTLITGHTSLSQSPMGKVRKTRDLL